MVFERGQFLFESNKMLKLPYIRNPIVIVAAAAAANIMFPYYIVMLDLMICQLEINEFPNVWVYRWVSIPFQMIDVYHERVHEEERELKVVF